MLWELIQAGVYTDTVTKLPVKHTVRKYVYLSTKLGFLGMEP